MTAAEVMLWNTKIGAVAYDDTTGLGAFEYDRNFLASGIEVSPIMMPLSQRVYTFPELAKNTFHGLPGMLVDSLPDKFGNAVIDAWLQSQGRSASSFNPVERLCYTGNRGMGALEYVPAHGPSSTETESIQIDRLVWLASEVLKSQKNMQVTAGKDAMAEIIKVGSSAGGARAKAVIAWNEVTGDIRSGQIDAGKGYGYWLIKFDGVAGNGDKEDADDPQYTRIEYACYLMAVAAGIQMNESRLYQENGRYHFMTKRFDRDPVTGAKYHMQSLGGIAHFDFNLAGAYSYEQTARVMRQLGLSGTEIAQFFRRMVFNVMVRNQDDHVKNISFLMNRRGQWNLSPAYDMAYAYNPGGIWTGIHQMSIHGKRDGITLEDVLSAGKNMGLKHAEMLQIIAEVRSSMVRWFEFSDRAKLKESLAVKIHNQFLIF